MCAQVSHQVRSVRSKWEIGEQQTKLQESEWKKKSSPYFVILNSSCEQPIMFKNTQQFSIFSTDVNLYHTNLLLGQKDP